MRNVSGKILLRLDPEIYQQLVKEAFETGKSINQLCIAAIMLRKELRIRDPWKRIEEVWKTNKSFKEKDVAAYVAERIKKVRRSK